MVAKAAIDIDAPCEVVWSILMDIDHYGEWNPFVYRVTGTVAVGETVVLSVRLGKQKMKQPLIVRQVEAPTTLIWTMKSETNPFLRGGRTQIVEDLGGQRCRYRTREELVGLISPLVGLATKRAIQHGLETSSAALKARAEAV